MNDTFTINTEKPITISGTTTSENVFVAKDVSANITLDGVNIDVSSISETAAFKIEDDSTGNVTITLADDSENTLKSGEGCAGLQKNGSVVIIGTLTIQGGANGTGTLTATGGDGGAGIGGGYMGAAKNITIDSAIITAKGASGIGSGRNGDGVDVIQIIKSTVKATGFGGAGIGGSDDSSLSNLIISKSTVTATGGASGIGGGKGGSTYWGGDCTDVTIEDSVVVATGSGGAGIGTGNAKEDANRSNDGFYYCNNITIIVSITAKLNKDAPAESEFELSFDLLSDNTYTATITTALTGVEYSFDGTNWSNTNTKAVGHAETLTGYIRFVETDEYNVSPYSSKTAATGHGTLTHHDAKAATCTEDGNIEYWTCDSCKLYFSDENGKTEITQEQTVLTKLGHKWAETYNFDKDGHWHQ